MSEFANFGAPAANKDEDSEPGRELRAPRCNVGDAFIEIDDMIHGTPLPGWHGRFFHSENMTFAHWDVVAGAADLHEHSHLQEEVWNIVEGEMVLVIGGQSRTLGAGAAAVVPPNVLHSARVTGACRVIVTDYPLRLELPGGARGGAPAAG